MKLLQNLFLTALCLLTAVRASASGGSPSPGEDLVRLFARAEKGGALRAVAIGGSITQAGRGWIGDWLARRFPKCRTMMFNAGMSATGSSLGVPPRTRRDRVPSRSRADRVLRE